MFKYLMFGVLVLGVYVLFGTEAEARVCVIYKGGTCVYWSGSVECDITANQLGNITNDPKSASCTIEPLPGEGGILGLVLCDSPGVKRHASPGIQFGVVLPGSFEGITTISKVDKNGAALTFVTASADDLQLSSLNSSCPNPNWTAFDFVPCAMQATAEIIDDAGTLFTAKFNCSLPNCATLQWDKVTQTIEKRQYDCTQVQ